MGSVRRPPVPAVRLDGAMGAQRNSMRPTSARFSFSSRPRFPDDKQSCDMPGPGDYDRPSVFRGPTANIDQSVYSGRSAVIGTAGAAVDSRREERDKGFEREASVPDSARLKFNAPPRATFGKEERMGKVMDTEYIRACPDVAYGSNSPGLIYSPHERPARPRSAGFTMRGRKDQGTVPKRSSTPTKVAPNSYPGAREDAFGVQQSSRRRTASCSSFGRAERFPAPKQASGTVTDDCINPRSDFGDQYSGRRGAGVHAHFGSARREGTTHAGANREARPPLATVDRLNLPHPPLAPQKEILRFGDNFSKPS